MTGLATSITLGPEFCGRERSVFPAATAEAAHRPPPERADSGCHNRFHPGAITITPLRRPFPGFLWLGLLAASAWGGAAPVIDLAWSGEAKLLPCGGGEDGVGPSKADLARLWDDLANGDAAVGDRAVWALAAGPAEAVAFLNGRLPRAGKKGGDRASAGRLIAQLDDDDFGQRQKAARELERLGQAAVPALRAALGRKPSPEVRRRIERLLARHEGHSVLLPPGDTLRAARAIHVLELIGTPEARKVLEELSTGLPSRLSEDAREALGRLARRAGGRR